MIGSGRVSKDGRDLACIPCFETQRFAMLLSMRPENGYSLSLARKARLSFLQKRLHAFAVVRMRTGLALQIAFEVKLRRQVVVLGGIERPLDQAQPKRRRGREMHA